MPLTPYHKKSRDSLNHLASTLWRTEAAALLAQPEPKDADAWLSRALDIQRLHKLHVAGLAHDPAFRIAALNVMPRWETFTSPPVPIEKQHALAARLYNIRSGQNDAGLITGGDGARNLLVWLVDKCRADNAPFIAQITDPDFSALLLNQTSDEGVQALAGDHLAMTAGINRHMIAGAGGSAPRRVRADPERERAFARLIKPFHERRMSGEVFYTLTHVPGPRDAAIDGIPYPEYLDLFFAMCDQPWEQMGRAQEALIAEFNTAETVRITNADGTDITMSLIDHDGSHFTFCNSLVAKNVPGSEIFSAPRRDSVNGIVVARGKFSEHGSALMENLMLEFKDGRLIRADAERGQDALDRILSRDDGTRFVGELGIGTNPALRRHVVNGLLVEKIGGSFHLALGAAYQYTEYGGLPVKVDNGNRSGLHWDITTMLYGRQGRITLDGRMIMDDGLWLDAKYDVLNRGWAAVTGGKDTAR